MRSPFRFSAMLLGLWLFLAALATPVSPARALDVSDCFNAIKGAIETVGDAVAGYAV